MSDSDKKQYRILTLDGGGSKGFYSLGVLKEVEGMLGSPLHNHFQMIYGTSTGSIIAALISLGFSIDDIYKLYKEHVTTIMKKRTASKRSSALKELTTSVFSDKTFSDVKMAIGIVATKWDLDLPMIFKASVKQAHGRTGTFVPGFGVSIADAVEASCSAYPFFKRKVVQLSNGNKIELIDGGYCANNPCLYALADATAALSLQHDQIRVLTVGVGVYPKPNKTYRAKLLSKTQLYLNFWIKTLDINSQSMEQLRSILYKDVQTVRVNDTFHQPEMATDFLEKNLEKLNLLHVRGGESFGKQESDIKNLFKPN